MASEKGIATTHSHSTYHTDSTYHTACVFVWGGAYIHMSGGGPPTLEGEDEGGLTDWQE